jgi:hypothetical protein
MRSIAWATATVSIVALSIGAGQALAGDDATAPSLDDVRAATAALPRAVSVSGPDRGAYSMFAPVDPPPPAAPPVPRTEPGVTVYGQPSGAPTATMAETVPYGGGWSPTGLGEDTRLGPAGQPEWTTERRWARVRSYVIAPGQVEFESWYRGRYKRNGQGEDRHIFQEELSVGLPHRFQVDLYLNFEHEDSNHFHFAETQAEVRWALADWDCIPWNPTLYFEYKLHDDPTEPDVAEGKLLFSKDLAPRWKAGVNLTYEKELKGEEEEIFGATAAVSYTVCDQRLSVGAEFQWERATVETARNDPENTFYAGPSIQFRTSSTTHLDVAPLFGLNDASQRMQLFIVFGIEIGGSGGEGGWLNPISASSR